MDWRVKAVAQAILSDIPLGDRVNDTLQRTLGGRKSSSLSEGVKGKLRGVARMQEALSEARFDLHGKDLLEIGTGWAPVHAVYLSLLGARVTTFDVKRRLKATSYARRALAAFLDAIPGQATLNTERRHSLDAFLRGRIDCDALLQALDVTYVAPVGDGFLLQLPPSSFDLVFSMDVLEHVRPARHGRDSARTEAHPATGRSGVPRHRPGRSPHERRSVDHILELPAVRRMAVEISVRIGWPTTTVFARRTSCACFRDMAPTWSGASPAWRQPGEGPSSSKES